MSVKGRGDPVAAKFEEKNVCYFLPIFFYAFS